jgi:mycothiol synthase
VTTGQLALRRPVEADAAAVAALCNSITRELYGTDDADEQEVRKWFGLPDLGTLVAERDGQMLGYVDVADEAGTRFPIDLRIAPGDGRKDVAAKLLAAAEDWARARAQPGSRARGFVPERDRELAAVLERAGYSVVRHSFHMLIEPLDRLEPPSWPAGFTIRTYEPACDEQAVYECIQDAFGDHWDFRPIPIERWRAFAFGRDDFDPSLWWLAETDGELAGACLNSWHFSGDRTFGWIGSLGVRRPWRRRGLALALLLHSFADFKRRGATRVGLGVDAENTTGAVRLYKRAGMSVDRRNDNYDKAL